MTTCSVCNRPLIDTDSIARGMGPICASHQYKNSEVAQRTEFADELDLTPFHQAFVMKRKGFSDDADVDRRPITNVPHLVVHHSPNGFEFGYGGSGPADLALNVCQLYLNLVGYRGRKTKCFDGTCWTLAWALHQDFKRAFIENAPHRGTAIPFEKIEAWFKGRLTHKYVCQFDDDEN